MSTTVLKDLGESTELTGTDMAEIKGGLWSHTSLGLPGGYYYSSEYFKKTLTDPRLPYPGDPDSPEGQPTILE